MVRDSQISRRTFLGGVAGTLVSIGLPGTFMVLAEPIRQSVAAQVRKDGKPRVPPGQTPIEYIPDTVSYTHLVRQGRDCLNNAREDNK